MACGVLFCQEMMPENSAVFPCEIANGEAGNKVLYARVRASVTLELCFKAVEG
jgi:hypothetical protein